MTKAPIKGCTWEHRDSRAEILFVTNMWPDDERPVYGIFVKRQIESLQQTGISCDILYIRGYEGLSVYLRAALWFLVHRRAVSRRYRLIHAHAGETALAAGLAFGIPRVASYCGDDVLGQARPDGTFSRRALLRRWLIQQGSRLCVLTITKSQEMAKALPRSVKSSNFVVPNGVDEHQFFPTSVSDARLRLGWKPQARIILFAATHPRDPRKRLDLAQAATRHAESELGPIQLVIAENVKPDELPVMMNAADCLLLTSRMEGSPNVVKEALMCNLPVISTRVGDVVELLEGVHTCAVCNGTPHDLGSALINVLRSGQRSDGRTKRSELTQAKIAERVLDIYRQAGYQAHKIADPQQA